MVAVVHTDGSMRKKRFAFGNMCFFQCTRLHDGSPHKCHESTWALQNWWLVLVLGSPGCGVTFETI